MRFPTASSALVIGALLFIGACGDAGSTGSSRAAQRPAASAAVQRLVGATHLPAPADRNALRAAVQRHYPKELRSGGTGGAVLVDVHLDARGVVRNVTLPRPARRPLSENRIVLRRPVPGTDQVVEHEVQVRHDPRFNAAAVAAIRDVRFLPALRNGQRVPYRLRMTIDFPPPAPAR